MSPIRRRSSRLRSNNGTPHMPSESTSHRLPSLAERDESPTRRASSPLDNVITTPCTPATVGRARASHNEMHPSKAQRSTAREPDSGLRLGFTDIGVAARQNTPSKSSISSSSFNFRFAHPVPELGPEAQRMMDDLREEAMRIKTKLAAEREEEKRKGTNNSAVSGGRKIAQPKGKVGRFSDVHMAEFKKMDSIVGHASSFRAQPGRGTPTSLKRSQSKAKLNDRSERIPQFLTTSPEHAKLQHCEERASSQKAMTSLKRSHSKAKLADPPRPNITPYSHNLRLDNESPAKRARQSAAMDVSSTSNLISSKPTTPTLQRSRSNFQSITTPTQSSLARAASAKQIRTQIPMLSRSATKQDLTPNRKKLPKTNVLAGLSISESSHKFFAPGGFRSEKSVRQLPANVEKPAYLWPTNIPSPVTSWSKANINKELPSIPTTPSQLEHSKSVRYVKVTPKTINNAVPALPHSPSPVKSNIPRSKSNLKLATVVSYPNISSAIPSSNDIQYPSLKLPCPLSEPPQKANMIPSNPSAPGNFTFQSDKTIKFGASRGFGLSPGQISLRQVVEKISPATLPGSFPEGNKENSLNPTPVTRGLSNKRRRRLSSDDEQEDETERSPKKHKGVTDGEDMMGPKIIKNMTPVVKILSPAKRGVLTLRRLNLLARPKSRK